MTVAFLQCKQSYYMLWAKQPSSLWANLLENSAKISLRTLNCNLQVFTGAVAFKEQEARYVSVCQSCPSG